MQLPLEGIRVQLSGSVPEKASAKEADNIRTFVGTLTQELLSEGAVLIHGSHPSLTAPIIAAAKAFVSSGGSRDSVVMVRAQKYCQTAEHLREIEEQRKFMQVQEIPKDPEHPDQDLLSMREWMSERSDAVVAVGGKWYDTNKPRAGVPKELEEALKRGKSGFVVGGFGGAISQYAEEDPVVWTRLCNGLSADENSELSKTTDVEAIVHKIISQLKLLPLARGKSLPGGRFRILALDGGGIRGVFTAAVLAKWDEMLGLEEGQKLVDHFDLVAGTSTGAILAIGLGLGLSPLEMLNFYRDHGSKIFPKNRNLRHWLKSKHESETLREILQTVFGEKRLSDCSKRRLVIPTVRAKNGKSETITTNHSLDRTAFKMITAVDAALATAAAPTYFDEANVSDNIADGTYLDGGIWANNPVLAAVAEAVRYLNVPLNTIDVLGVGTLGHERDFSKFLIKGKLGWASDVADLFFSAQEHAAATLADSLLSKARHYRVNELTPKEIALDDTGAMDDMARRGKDVGQDSFSVVRSRFLDKVFVPDWEGSSEKTK